MSAIEVAAPSNRGFVVLWNPAQEPWSASHYQGIVHRTKNGDVVGSRWSSGNNKSIRPGDRLFLVRQHDNRGIIGSAYATSNVFPGKGGQRRLLIRIKFDVLLPTEDVLPVETLELLNLGLRWKKGLYASGIRIPEESLPRLEAAWRKHLSQFGRVAVAGSAATDDESLDDDEAAFPEGRLAYRMHRIRERNPALVAKAKQRATRAGALRCMVCGFDFYLVYGELGRDFIECHHTVPVSEYAQNQKTRLTDMALVCSNCHRMLHRRRPWLTTEELAALIQSKP